jgi:hypothetical protein
MDCFRFVFPAGCHSWEKYYCFGESCETLPSMAMALEPCQLEVVEEGSGWPVPLVELRTTHGVRLITDNAGIAAFDLPEWMGRETWLTIQGNGYGVKADGFGYEGVRFTPQPGGKHQIKITRRIIAKRLGRLTGAGRFAESQRCGRFPEWVDTGIAGCDSVQNAVHNGRMFWAWGDTALAGYPLGVFDMTGAFTAVQPLDSFEPPLRLAFNVIHTGEGKPRGIAKMPGTGPTWVSGVASLPDKNGKAQLVGTYIKVRGYLEAWQCGLCVWDEESNRFRRERVVWTKSAETPDRPPVPDGHPAIWKDDTGKPWVLFGNPFPNLRFPATYEAWQDAATWEVLKPQAQLKAAGSDAKVIPHSGSIAWNPWRKRWVTVFVESGGKPSGLGEVWYAEAPQPGGPWGPAVKVLSHPNYSFYNPRLHPEFTPGDSPVLLFEGTYTSEFADRPEVTPRWNYNQILYRLDLDDPALHPAAEQGKK